MSYVAKLKVAQWGDFQRVWHNFRKSSRTSVTHKTTYGTSHRTWHHKHIFPIKRRKVVWENMILGGFRLTQ